MDPVVLKTLIALVPVLACLATFIFLDAFKLMSLREIVLLLAGGGALAAISYFANWRAMDELPMGYTAYSLYAAPVVEETAKGALILVLFWRNRIGYMIDAAIAGFAIGAGFSVGENLFYCSIVDVERALTARGYPAGVETDVILPQNADGQVTRLHRCRVL